VIVEVNRRQSPRLREIADIFIMPPPRHRNAKPVFHPLTRIGRPYAMVDPQKVLAVFETDEPGQVAPFADADNEHSVQIIVTEQGLADLRGLGPMQRADVITERCAHPLYRDYLRRHVREARPGHIRHDFLRCFELHRNLMEHGTMLPGQV
jgi:acyl-CoA hydrolase